MMNLIRKAKGLSRNVVLAALGGALLVTGATTAQATVGAQAKEKPTIVLLHGAYADGNSWSEVTGRLQK